MKGHRLCVLLASMLAAGVVNALTSVQTSPTAQLTQADYETLGKTSAAMRSCYGELMTKSPPTALTHKRLIALGVSEEMKARFLANLSPWSSDRVRFEALDPAKSEDVETMFELLARDTSRPGTIMTRGLFRAQVLLYSYYNALSAGACDSTPEFKALLPRLRADGWPPLRSDKFDMEIVRKDVDQAYDCFWASIPAEDRQSKDAVRKFIATKSDMDELQRDVYEFAVNLKTSEDRRRAAIYLSNAPNGGTPAENAGFFIGFFFGPQAQWDSVQDLVKANVLGTYHLAKATPTCRLDSQSLALIGKSVDN